MSENVRFIAAFVPWLVGSCGLLAWMRSAIGQ
jgi:hypothetical protein